MKKVTRFFSLLLAIAMVLAMNFGTLSVMADGDTYTITINGTAEEHTYSAYQIFSGSISDGKLIDIDWATEFKGSDFLTALKASDTSVVVYDAAKNDGSTTTSTVKEIFENCTTARDVADKLAEYNPAGSSDTTLAEVFAEIASSYIGTAAGSSSASGTTYTISGLSAGYYLVKDTATLSGNDSYTDYILWVSSDVQVTPKSSVPTVDKKVQEESYDNNDGYGTGYDEVADYDIGDNVPFELIGTMPSTLDDYKSYKYIFHDVMSSALSLNTNSIVVKVDVNGDANGDASQMTTLDESAYTIAIKNGTNSTSLTDSDCTFEIIFSDILGDNFTASNTKVTLTSSSKIYVYYTAELTDEAVIGLTGNENEVKLEYSNNPNTGGESETGTTPEEKVIVFTYELDVTKVDGTTGDELENAQFVLYRLNGTTKEYVVVDTNSKVTNWTENEYNATGVSPVASVLTSGSDGVFKVIGLDDGTYYLEEIAAPDGYNSLTTYITLVINATTTNNSAFDSEGTTNASEALTSLTLTVDGSTATNNSCDTGIVATNVKNYSGATLPETGGMGTKIFYTLGGVLVIGAGVLLIVKRRMRNA